MSTSRAPLSLVQGCFTLFGRRTLCVLFWSIALLASMSPLDATAQEDTSFSKAKAAYQEGRYEEAKELYVKVVEMRDQIVTGAQAEIKSTIQKEEDEDKNLREKKKVQPFFN